MMILDDITTERIADVYGWAWERKAFALREHLGDAFDVEVAYQYQVGAPPVRPGADLYSTFEVFQASAVPDGAPYVTGITAHVWEGLEQRFSAAALRNWSARAAAFHANSVLLQREMERRLERPIAYCPNGVDEAFFRRTRPRSSGAHLVVGWVGKPAPRKGGAIVAAACKAAGVELRTVERRHTDALPPEAMREFYQDLHVLAVASDMDGTPNPALEAAACGVAVVSNRIGNMPEFITDGVNGRLVEREAGSLAAALRELTPQRAAAMGEAARAEIERAWTWRALSSHYAALWRGALA